MDQNSLLVDDSDIILYSDITHGHVGDYQRVAAKVLANRPGFPFHGNAFFRECGDAFAAIALDNPATRPRYQCFGQLLSCVLKQGS